MYEVITADNAYSIAEQFIQRWNSKNLDYFLELVSDDMVLRSSLVIRVIPESNGVIQGKEILRNYWSIILEKFPDHYFTIKKVEINKDKIILFYDINGNLNYQKSAVGIVTLNSENRISQFDISYI